MSAAAGGFSERLVDAVGPIVVKEVRQGLRAKVFAICFGLLLFACLVVALIAAEIEGREGETMGPKYLTLFSCGLGLVCFFVIPYTAYRSMAREREDETWVLLVLTGLSSRRIVRGKVASALSQAVLYSSAGAPFMLFSYFLNGVDLPTLGLVVLFASCWAIFLTSLAVALGTEGRSRIGRSLIHFLVLALLVAATVGGMAFGVNLAEKGSRWFAESGFQIFILFYVALTMSVSLLLVEGAAAGLSLATESSVGAVRAVLLMQHVVGIAATYLGMSLYPGARAGTATIGSLTTSLLLVAAGFFFVSEADGFPRANRGGGSWLTAGGLRGWRLIMLMLAADTIAWAALHRLASHGTYYGFNWDHHELAAMFAAPLYVGFYLSLAVVVGRLSSLRRLGEPLATRIAFFGAVLAAAVLSPVVAVISGKKAANVDYNHLNPIFGLVNFLDRADKDASQAGLMMLLIGFLLMAPTAWLVLRRLDKVRTT
jgi:hypothetical protein